MKIKVLRMQLRHMYSRSEFKFSLTLVFLVVTISFYTLCSKVYGLDKSQLYSAAYGWVGHAAFLDIPIMQIFFLFFIFFIGSMAFSDSQFVDKKNKVRDLIITRCSLHDYVMGGALASFLGAFIVIFIPFIFSQALSYIVFPIHGTVSGVMNGIASWQNDDYYSTLFSALYYNHPLLYNLISIFYMSICTGVLAVFSFSLSLYIKRGRLLIIGIPTIIVILEGILFPGRFTFTYYLYMGSIPNMIIQVYLGFPLTILILSCILIEIKIHIVQDILP